MKRRIFEDTVGQNASRPPLPVIFLPAACEMGSFSGEVIYINPLRRNSDLSQTSHCNIKGLSVGEVMKIENTITRVKFY